MKKQQNLHCNVSGSLLCFLNSIPRKHEEALIAFCVPTRYTPSSVLQIWRKIITSTLDALYTSIGCICRYINVYKVDPSRVLLYTEHSKRRSSGVSGLPNLVEIKVLSVELTFSELLLKTVGEASQVIDWLEAIAVVVVVSFGVFVLGYLPLFRLAGVVGSDNPAVEFE